MNPDPTWHHETRTADGHTTIALSGEIDMSGAATLHHLLQQAVHTAETVTIDLAGVGFIDSTVISALVAARNTGRQVTAINPTAQVRRVLHITGILDTPHQSTRRQHRGPAATGTLTTHRTVCGGARGQSGGIGSSPPSAGAASAADVHRAVPSDRVICP